MIILLGVFLAVAILVIVLRLLVLRRIREKYAALWLLLGVLLLTLGLFPGLLEKATSVLGVQLPVNLFFAASIVILLGVTLHLSWELSMNEDEVRRLAEEVAILGALVNEQSAISGIAAVPSQPSMENETVLGDDVPEQSRDT